MKKNITINLFGSLYAIDNDAYDLLEEYLENMKRYFSTRDGGDEIADDIEHRVAEILAEMKANGLEAISIEHVQEIIHRIGNPEEMDEEGREEDSSTAPNGSQFTGTPPEPPHPNENEASESGRKKKSKLFRDPEDHMIGGVISGLCKYFGGTDPLPFRILAVCLLYFPVTILFYLIAWAFIPMARTTEEMLQMRGKPVNPQTLNEELIRTRNRMNERMRAANLGNKGRNFLDTLLHIVVLCIKIGLLFITALIMVSVVAAGAFLSYASFGGLKHLVHHGFIEKSFAEMTALEPMLWVDYWIIAIAALVFFGILLYILIRSLLKKPTDKDMSKGSRITLGLIAVLAIPVAITFSILNHYHLRSANHQYEINRNTINGVYMKEQDRQELNNRNWKIISYTNCNEDGILYKCAPSLSVENEHDIFMHFTKNETSQPMAVQVERDIYLPEGYYHLESIGAAPGYGLFVYAKAGDKLLAQVPIPGKNSQKEGNMKFMSPEELNQTVFFDIDLSKEGNNGYVPRALEDWSYARSKTFYHSGGTVSYGGTNIPEIVGLNKPNSDLSKFSLKSIEIVKDSIPNSSKNL